MNLLPLRIIPSLIIKNGRLVKGKEFKNHIDVGDPITTSKAFDAQGADEIFIIDLASYKNPKRKIDFKSLEKISKNIMTPITIGGGINTLSKAIDCFKFGADKIYLSKILFEEKNLLNKISNIYGNQSMVCGINILKKKNKFLIYENEKINIENWFNKINKLPIGEIKITFVNNEGTLCGINLDFCKKISKFFDHPVIIEGGIGNLNHIREIAQTKVSGIALGTLLNFSEQNVIKIKQFLTNNKIKVRL